MAAAPDSTTVYYVAPFSGGWRVCTGGAYGPRFATKEEAIRQATDAALARRGKGAWVDVQVLGEDARYHPHSVSAAGWRRS
jgi:hypothetical protein